MDAEVLQWISGQKGGESNYLVLPRKDVAGPFRTMVLDSNGCWHILDGRRESVHTSTRTK